MRTIMPAMTLRLGASLALAAVLASSAQAVARSPGASPMNSAEPVSPSAASITYPQGSTDVVLRMDTGDGFVPTTYG